MRMGLDSKALEISAIPVKDMNQRARATAKNDLKRSPKIVFELLEKARGVFRAR